MHKDYGHLQNVKIQFALVNQESFIINMQLFLFVLHETQQEVKVQIEKHIAGYRTQTRAGGAKKIPLALVPAGRQNNKK